MRLHNAMNSKFQNINKRIQHNYNYIIKLTREKYEKMSQTSLNDFITYYKTTEEQCLCSDNKLASSNYKIDIPCYHRLRFGATFPETPVINLDLSHSYSNLEVEYEFIPDEDNPENELTDEINYISRQVKHFSHYNNIEEIRKYIETHYRANEGIFINNQKVSTIQLIEEGIFYFQKLKKEKKK